MAYPSRGAWRFRNVTQAFDFAPILTSITIEEVHPDGLSTFNGRVRDTGGIFFQNEDRIWAKFEGDKIWAGHCKVRTRTFLDEKGQREKAWDLQGQDYTSKLEDSVITRREDRPRESADDRVAFILGHLNFAITTTGVDLPAENVDRANYENMTVREALQQVADELILHFYIDFGPDDGGPPDLHMFRTETFDSPIDLDVDAPNYTTRFPFSEFHIDGDSQDLKNAVRVRGGTQRRWVLDQDSIDQYGRQETALTDSELHSLPQLTAAGNRVLDQNDAPEIHGELLCHEPGLRAGMRFPLRLDAWSLDTNYIATQVSISAVDPEDADNKALLFSRVSFSDKRRVGRMPGGGRSRGGGSGGDGGGRDDAGDGRSTKDGRSGGGGGGGGCGCPADLTEYAFEDWDRDVDPHSADTVDIGSIPDTPGRWWEAPLPWNTGGANAPSATVEVDLTKLIATFPGPTSGTVSFSVYDDPDENLPGEGSWRFDVETDAIRAGSRVSLNVSGLVDSTFQSIVLVDFGNSQISLYVQDDVGSDDAQTAFSYSAAARYSIEWDMTVPGTFRARIWETADPSNTAVVEVVRDMEAPNGYVALTVAGGGGGAQETFVYPIYISQGAQSGESVERLAIGVGDGSTVTFDMPQEWRAGSAHWFIDDAATTPDSYSIPSQTVTFDAAPDIGAEVEASYVVA